MREGTVQSRLFDLLGINETLKEVLIMAVQDHLTDKIFAMLRDQFQLHRRFRGIAFSMPYRQFVQGTGEPQQPIDRNTTPYVCLMVVLEKGQGEECMRIARAAGAAGGTIIHARGAGVPKTFYFPLMIEPQKDLLMIVTGRGLARAIRDAVYQGMALHQPGKGIIFSMPVNAAIGLYEGRGRGVKG